MIESVLRVFERRKAVVCILAGLLIGAWVGLSCLDPHFIMGTGGKWIRPDNDYIAYLVAWNYFLVDHWRFPLFSLPAMGYPEGGNVLFNDALPLAAAATKILYQLTGARLNPFGWWIFLTYVLQGAMATRVVWAVGVRSIWACAAAAVLTVTSGYFVARMGHTALSSHFLLLWALAVYFESVRKGRARILESSVLLGVALLVNSYLFVMVFVFVAMTMCALALRSQLTWRQLGGAALGAALVAALGLVSGYGVLLVNPSTMKGAGFGLYSWNPVSLALPPDGVFGYLTGVPRDATGGQYEGEAYLGLGVVLMLALALVVSPRQLIRHVRNHALLVMTLTGFAAYAASNRVYFSNSVVLEYPLPGFVLDLTGFFRANGRFIWPVAYSLAILPVAFVFRYAHPALAISAAILAAFVQLREAQPGMEYRRYTSATAYEELIDTRVFESWLLQHRRLWQYPSWVCGGLEGTKRSWGNRESNRELQVELATAKAGIPTNSVYTSRVLKECRIEFDWLNNPQLEDGVLYLFGPEAVTASPVLTALARSNACVTFPWAVVCSRKWASMAAARQVGQPQAQR